jgi:hypothetical protein
MALIPQHLSFYAGDSKTATINLTNDSDGTAFVPAAGYHLIFTAKDSLDDADSLALFQYSSGVGITHAGSTAQVVLHPEDTRAFGSLKLYWDIQAENLLVAGDIRTVAIGTLSLKQDATRQTTTSVPIHTITPGVPYTGPTGPPPGNIDGGTPGSVFGGTVGIDGGPP